MMNIKLQSRALLFAALLVGSGMAYADDDLDVTMRMVPSGVELPDAVTKVITLPSPPQSQASEHANDNAANGLDRANEVRESVELPQVEVPQVELPEQAKGRGRP